MSNLNQRKMKKIFKTLFVVAVAIIAGYNVYQSKTVMNGMSELALANVEALAGSESGGNSITCYSGSGSSFLCKCSSCTWGYVGTSSKGTCY